MNVKLNGRMQRIVMDQGYYVSFEWILGIDRTCRVSKYIIDKVQ